MIENRQKSWFRRTDALIAAFAVPVLIMVIIYAERGIFPFGNRAYLRTDLYHQYAPFMSEFQYKLTHGGSLLYSWDVGLGVNFSALYAYYLASPLNWAVALVPKAYIIEFISVLIILKTGLAGLTETVYLSRHSKNSSFAPALFGIFYALSGYMAAYSWNIMWLDCIVLFPLICLGLEKLVYEKRGLLYVITLGISILSNYYISIMICIFMVIYLVALLILKGKQSFGSFAGTLAVFAGYSLLAGALAAVVLVPEIFALQYTASEDLSFPQTVNEYFSIVEELARHLINVETEQTLDHWPNVYCGVAVLPLALLFIANKKISLKEKIVYGVIGILFLASFSLNALSFIWHGLHYPNSLPARQSFIYIWVLLYIGFRTADEIEGTAVRHIAYASLISLGFIILCQAIVKDDAFTWSTWYLSLGFVGIYCLLLYLFRAGKININVLTFILLGVCSVEAAVNMTMTGISTTSRDQYVENNDATRAVVEYVEDDRDFYRFEMNERKAKDDGAWLNFHSVSLFSSLAHEDISKLFSQLGCDASTNAYCIKGSTPLVDALFDIKYAIYQGRSYDHNQKIVCECNETRLYKNEYCLPLGFMIPDGLQENWVIEAGSPILVQNQLATVMGADRLLVQVDGFNEGSDYTFTAPEDGLYYAYSENSATNEITVSVGDSKTKYENVKRGYLLELGWLEKNTMAFIGAADDTATQVHVYRFNYDALARITEKLGASPMQVNTYDDTHIYAGVDVEEAGTLATTIPYDPGWTVRVDGQEVTKGKFINCFISLELTSGHHDLEFEYEPEGLKLGFMITGGALAALILIVVITLIVDGHRRRKAELAEETGDAEETADEKDRDEKQNGRNEKASADKQSGINEKADGDDKQTGRNEKAGGGEGLRNDENHNEVNTSPAQEAYAEKAAAEIMMPAGEKAAAEIMKPAGEQAPAETPAPKKMPVLGEIPIQIKTQQEETAVSAEASAAEPEISAPGSEAPRSRKRDTSRRKHGSSSDEVLEEVIIKKED